MPQITVRQVPDEIHRALKAQAERDGMSAEAKARQILAEGLFPPAEPRLGARLQDLARTFGVAPDGLDIARDRSGLDPAEFG